MNWHPPHPAIAGLILAGGRSRRMGHDKAELLWRGQSLLQRARALLASVGVDPIRIGGRPDLPDGLPDRDPHAGPARAILDAAEALQAQADYLLVIPVDMPLLQAEHLQPLLCGMDGTARHWAGHPLPALIPVSVRELQASDIRSVHRLLATIAATGLPVETAPPGEGAADPFANINTPEAFALLPASR